MRQKQPLTSTRNKPLQDRIKARLSEFANLQINIVSATLTRLVVERLEKIPEAELEAPQQSVLVAARRAQLPDDRLRSMRAVERDTVRKVLAARKGQAYLRTISQMCAYAPVTTTPISSESDGERQRRAQALKVLEQFLQQAAQAYSKILVVEIDDPSGNPFSAVHQVDAFTSMLDRWAKTFYLPPRRVRTPVETNEEAPSVVVDPSLIAEAEATPSVKAKPEEATSPDKETPLPVPSPMGAEAPKEESPSANLVPFASRKRTPVLVNAVARPENRTDKPAEKQPEKQVDKAAERPSRRRKRSTS